MIHMVSSGNDISINEQAKKEINKRKAFKRKMVNVMIDELT